MLYLIILDFFWSAAALWVDIPKLPGAPVWAWPFIVVCPIYPFLLAWVWIAIIKKRDPNPYLLSFATIPSAVFGPLAILFYGAFLEIGGLHWQDFGQIFWVAFYSIQGWYLLSTKKLKILPILAVVLYLAVKFLVDYRFKTFGYFTFDGISDSFFTFLFLWALGSTAVVAAIAFWKVARQS